MYPRGSGNYVLHRGTSKHASWQRKGKQVLQRRGKQLTYNPHWKMEYIELKGWDNMSEGEKYLCTHTISSSVEGMGNMKLMAELKVMKAKAKGD